MLTQLALKHVLLAPEGAHHHNILCAPRVEHPVEVQAPRHGQREHVHIQRVTEHAQRHDLVVQLHQRLRLLQRHLHALHPLLRSLHAPSPDPERPDHSSHVAVPPRMLDSSLHLLPHPFHRTLHLRRRRTPRSIIRFLPRTSALSDVQCRSTNLFQGSCELLRVGVIKLIPLAILPRAQPRDRELELRLRL
eukprot:1169483-Rhodomonas_salina.4